MEQDGREDGREREWRGRMEWGTRSDKLLGNQPEHAPAYSVALACSFHSRVERVVVPNKKEGALEEAAGGRILARRDEQPWRQWF